MIYTAPYITRSIALLLNFVFRSPLETQKNSNFVEEEIMDQLKVSCAISYLLEFNTLPSTINALEREISKTKFILPNLRSIVISGFRPNRLYTFFSSSLSRILKKNLSG